MNSGVMPLSPGLETKPIQLSSVIDLSRRAGVLTPPDFNDSVRLGVVKASVRSSSRGPTAQRSTLRMVRACDQQTACRTPPSREWQSRDLSG